MRKRSVVTSPDGANPYRFRRENGDCTRICAGNRPGIFAVGSVDLSFQRAFGGRLPPRPSVQTRFVGARAIVVSSRHEIGAPCFERTLLTAPAPDYQTIM